MLSWPHLINHDAPKLHWLTSSKSLKKTKGWFRSHLPVPEIRLDPGFRGRQNPCWVSTSCFVSRLIVPKTHHSLNIQAHSLALIPNILALPPRLRFGFFVILFFVCIFAILASTRFGSRLTSLFSQIRPAPFPAFTRPITTSTMAPKQYKKPPQAPPRLAV